MLNKCAPDHRWEENDHYFQVFLGEKSYRTLPKGPHGGKGEIQRPWVRKLARHLEIVECAKLELPSLA